MLNDLMSHADASAVLEPHLSMIAAAIRSGWSDWQQALSANVSFGNLSKRSRANLVYDFMATHAETYFDSVDIPTTRKNGFLVIEFADGRLLLRFKKFRNADLKTDGIPTQQRLEIEQQQVTFDGMTTTFIVAGYLPDELGIQLDVIALACSYDGAVVWSIDLSQPDASIIYVGADQPVPPAVRPTRRTAREKTTSTS